MFNILNDTQLEGLREEWEFKLDTERMGTREARAAFAFVRQIEQEQARRAGATDTEIAAWQARNN